LTISRSIIQLRNAKTSEKINQSIYLLIAVVTIVLAAIMYFAMTFNYNVLPVDNWLNVVYGIIMAYTITRYHLMDIKIIIRKGLIYSSLTAIITFVYLAVVYLSEIVLKQIAGYNELWLQIPVILFLVLIFQPLKDKVQEKIDKTFFVEREFFKEAIKTERKSTIEKMRISLQHEINNPLAASIIQTQALIMSLEKEPDVPRKLMIERLKIVEGEMQRIKHLLKNLEEISDPAVKEYIPGVEMFEIKQNLQNSQLKIKS